MPEGLTGSNPEGGPDVTEETPAQTPREERRRSWWPFGRRNESSPDADRVYEGHEARAHQFANEERMEKFAYSDDSEDIVKYFERANFEQLHRMQLEKDHGRGIRGLYNKFTSGDLNFNITADGLIRHRAWMELAQRGTKVIFNKKNAMMVGTAAIAGVLTGGVSFAAVAGMGGALAGRGISEALDQVRGVSGSRREKILEADILRWQYMKELAQNGNTDELVQLKERESQEIADSDHSRGAELLRQKIQAEKHLEDVQKIQEKRNDVLAMAGGASAMAANFLMGINGLVDFGRFNFDHDATFHAVKKIKGAIQFIYNQGEGIGSHWINAVKSAGGAYHAGGSLELVRAIGAQTGVVAGNIAVWAFRALRQKNLDLSQIKLQERVEAHNRSIHAPEPTTENPPVAETISAQEQITETYGQENMPKLEETWLYQTTSGSSPCKIKDLLWSAQDTEGENCPMAVVELLDSAGNETQEKKQITISLSDLLEKAANENSLSSNWLENTDINDEIELPDGQENYIPNNDDPQKRAILPSNYKIIEKNRDQGNVKLQSSVDENNKPVANIFDLVIKDFIVGKPVQEKKTTDERNGLVPHSKWQKKNVQNIPSRFQEIDNFQINNVETGRVYGFVLDENAERPEGQIEMIYLPKILFLKYYKLI
jgi:hypothetical protein